MRDLRQTKGFLLLVLAIGVLMLVWQRLEQGKLVVYCAHDAVFAEDILRAFEKQTGIPVVIKYDTEATKSLGLVERIIREDTQPQGDVFWNNELLGTLDLAERGLLDPYQGSGWKRIPENFRDADGRWAGFGARLRMRIINTEHGDFVEPAFGPDGKTLADAGPKAFERFAIAKPLYGTTLTHYAALWQFWGGDKLRLWHKESRARGLREVNGNAAVKDIVADGTCGAGWTDTDDFFEAQDAKKPVRAVPIELENGATICIPNTVGIIKNTRQRARAERLVDFLLSSRAELALAKSKSRQLPLGPLDEKQTAELPPEVRDLIPAAAKGLPLRDLLKARNECLAWLKGEYLQ